jgi:hypothetical protein
MNAIPPANTAPPEPHLCRAASAAVHSPAAPRPTPQTTIEAVMWTVREGGLKALREPANQERLGRCDAAARAQINRRIEGLIAAGGIPGGVINA